MLCLLLVMLGLVLGLLLLLRGSIFVLAGIILLPSVVVLAMADEIWMTWKSIIAQEMEGNSERTLESVDDTGACGHDLSDGEGE